MKLHELFEFILRKRCICWCNYYSYG